MDFAKTLKRKSFEGAEVMLQEFHGQYSLYLRANDARVGVLYLIEDFPSFDRANSEYERMNTRDRILRVLTMKDHLRV